MPDAITPVGTMYTQQNPIAALSSIYGLQQQQLDIARGKQALQTGQSTQQSAQAQATIDQTKAAETQNISNLAKSAFTSGRYKGSDGNFDNQKFSNDVMAVAPNIGGQIASEATSRAGEIYKNQQTLFNLGTSERQQVGNAFTSVASMDNPQHSDLVDALHNVQQQYPNNPDIARMVLSLGTSVDPNASGDALKQRALQMASLTNAPNITQGMPGAGTNAAGQNQVVNPMTGKRSAPQLGPGATNPASPQVAGQTSAATLPYVGPAAAAAAGGSSRAGGAGNADILASNNVVAGQRDARTNIDLTTRIDQLADIVAPGALPAKVSAGLGALGLQDVTQARTELQKDLGRLRGPLADRAASDGRAGELLAGLPTDTTPTQTIHQAMDVQRGAAKQDLALGALRDKTAAATSGNMNGFQSQYSHAVGVASPLMHEYWSLPKADQAAFLKRNSSSPQQAQELRNRFEAARSQLNVGQ